MTLTAFKDSLQNDTPPPVSLPLVALWHEARGDWDRAHDLLQHETSGPGAWVHAYLHRKEGDTANAAYWYRRAGKPTVTGSLDSERDGITAELLAS